MTLFVKLLILLWLINLAPPLLVLVFDSRHGSPVDGGHTFIDGRPLFGRHKTLRGVAAGIMTGGLIGTVLGFPLWLGLGTGIFSMIGDLSSSFIKRRFSFASGYAAPGLDQIPEGLFPFILIAPHYSLTTGYIVLFSTIFGLGAYFGSVFLDRVLLQKPFESYPRRIRPLTRLRELFSCKITSAPFSHILNFEDAIYYHLFMKSIFKMLNIYERGKLNALVLEKREVSFLFRDLPPAFDGYTILFLSDLHIDGLDGLIEKTVEILRQTPADMCILGGDYRMLTYGSFTGALGRLRSLLTEIKAKDGIIGVLGNHDCVEIVETLRDLGIAFLVNDSLAVERDGERIWIVGADDCHYYKANDLESAFNGLPPEAFSIMVSHSNEIYKEAAAYKPNLFLCGHTHGGQILIPPFGPIFTHSKAPRRFCSGRWHYDGMLGYTSVGVGVSGVPVRFNSTGEVTVVTLRRA